MNRRNVFIWSAVVMTVFAVAIWLLRTPVPRADFHPTSKSSKQFEAMTVNGIPRPKLPPPVNLQTLVQPPPHGASESEKWAWWRRMSESDRFFEYKMPISFYGRVVDDKGISIQGAKIQFTWTDLSSAGTSKRDTASDTAGLFSLEGAVGKGLSVHVSKEGYRNYFSKNQISFEYAMFADPKYHEPNLASPVVFVLRKNRDTEPLVVRENQEAELSPGQSKLFTIGPNGAIVTIERLPDMGKSSRSWSAHVSVPSGGLVISTEEFPFEAPDKGYEPVVAITERTPRPPVWAGDNGATFFVKTPQGYGRITVRNTPGSAWVYVTSYFNPNPNSRNLEFDPAKRVKP